MTRWGSALACAGLMLGASGCRHKVRAAPPLPPVLVPMALVDVPRPADTPMLTPQPVKMPPMPVASKMAKLPREHRRTIVKAEEPAVVTPSPQAEAAAIGSLTAGGASNPQARQEATNLIASNERRLAALPTQRAEEQKGEIGTVRNFQKQAQDALNSGDAEGAMTLATKAKLLLDDLEK
ncbi:hypothetical protein [Edaphobacter acidisoli]|nr:hypothetical protein [Edaphobacter acidisoli]